MIDQVFDPDATTIHHLPPGLRRAVRGPTSSRRRDEILDYYRYCAREALPWPSVRDVGQEVGLESSSTVQNHLVALLRDRQLVRHRALLTADHGVHGARTILLPAGWWREEPSSEPCGECGRR